MTEFVAPLGKGKVFGMKSTKGMVKVYVEFSDRDYSQVVSVSRVPCLGESMFFADLKSSLHEEEGQDCGTYEVVRVLHHTHHLDGCGYIAELKLEPVEEADES